MTAGNKLWRNRKERKDWARRLRSENPGLEVVHPHAAGIDVGNSARITLPCGRTEIRNRVCDTLPLVRVCLLVFPREEMSGSAASRAALPRSRYLP
jgi:hypothetical protein